MESANYGMKMDDSKRTNFIGTIKPKENVWNGIAMEIFVYVESIERMKETEFLQDGVKMENCRKKNFI